MKRMVHKLHGYTHAYTEQEEKQMIANGWTEVMEVKPEVKPVITLKKNRSIN